MVETGTVLLEALTYFRIMVVLLGSVRVPVFRLAFCGADQDKEMVKRLTGTADCRSLAGRARVIARRIFYPRSLMRLEA